MVSRVQRDALHDLCIGGMTATSAQVHIGKSFRRTLTGLEDRGLVRFFPYGGGGEGAWKITKEGRQVHAERCPECEQQASEIQTDQTEGKE